MSLLNSKSDFPILSRQINGKPLVYLDNAASSQKPQAVIDAISDFYTNHNANVHRGIHTLSEEATNMYEEARAKVAKFINARHPEEIVFTRGTTESINLVANTWGVENIKSGDEIAITQLEHHGNMIPWQVLVEKTGATLKVLEIDESGFLKEGYKTQISPKTKLLAISEASNVLGTIQNIKEITKEVHKVGGLVLVDGAQAVPHMKVDVQSLNCDFYAFSGHKMLGPTGIGVLYVRKEILETMEPYQVGGGMIREVSYEKATYDDIPGRFEAGTPNIADAIGLGAAMDYLTKTGMENVRKHEIELLTYAFDKLSLNPKIEIYGPKKDEIEGRTGVISFNIQGVHPHDLASVLDAEGVAIRSGHHCAMPLHKKLGLPATARASFYLYNTKEDIDALLLGINKAVKILGS